MDSQIIDDYREKLVLYHYGFERFWTQLTIVALLQVMDHINNFTEVKTIEQIKLA